MGRRCAALVVLAAVLYGCGAEDARDDRQPDPPALPEAALPPDVRVKVGDGPRAARRVVEGCEPVEESRRYEALVDGRAIAVLQWTGMNEDAANLRIPVYVVGIEEGAVGVRFLKFPMREQYLHVWLGSGHIAPAPENVFLLDPCSATLEADES